MSGKQNRNRLIVAIFSLLWVSAALPDSLEFFVNSGSNDDYGRQTAIPTGFGNGEFTLEFWVRLNDSFPVGPTNQGTGGQVTNWANADNAPYSSSTWWYRGNFLLDGHNNGAFEDGTFSLQVYGGGRLRWLFGDGVSNTGGPWAVQASPATSTPSLLDGSWHQVTLVRRWSGSTAADLEMWIDGQLIDSETSSSRQNMRAWWNNWPGFGAEAGWFWAAEKQAALGTLSQYEDYKGMIDELRFWSRAKSAAEISANYDAPVTGGETGLVGWYAMGEGTGSSACNAQQGSQCISLINTGSGVWSSVEAPLSGGGGDTQAPTTPGNLQGSAVSTSQIDLTWNASTDNVGVVDYRVTRNGSEVGTPTGTSFSDTGLSPGTSYSYQVTARDAAGNVSAPASVNVSTMPGPDTQPPTTPGNLQGNAVSTSQIDLTWNASTDNVGVVDYLVARDGSQVGTPTGASFSDTGLSANTSYSYEVVARDAAGNVSTAAMVMAVTLANPDTQPPTQPGNFQATAVTSAQINLSWNASTDNVGVVDYLVTRDGSPVGAPTGTSFSDTGLNSNTSYSYTVEARDAAGNMSTPASDSATTLSGPDVTPPTTPGNLTGNAVSNSRVDLSWNASTDDNAVVDYRVTRDSVEVGTPSGTTFSDTGLSPGTQYMYGVAARDAAGNVSTPTMTSVTTLSGVDTTPPTPPTGVIGSVVSSTQLGLRWNASTDNVGVSDYQVFRGGSAVATTTSTSFIEAGLMPNTSYVYFVTARDIAGNVSPASGQVSMTTLVGGGASTNSGGGATALAFLLLGFSFLLRGTSKTN